MALYPQRMILEMVLDCAMVGHDKTAVYPTLKIVKEIYYNWHNYIMSEFQSQKMCIRHFFFHNKRPIESR